MRKSQRRSMIRNIAIVLVTALVLSLSTSPLIDAPVLDFALDGLIAGLLLCLLFFLLKNIVRYANYSSMPWAQQIVNYSFLGIAFATLWVGGTFYFTFLILPHDRQFEFLSTIPVRSIIALLIYGYSVLLFRYEHKKSLLSKENESIESEEVEANSNDVLIALIDHIAVKNGSKIDLVYTSEIVCIQAEGDYVMIYSTNGKYLKEQTMKSLEDGLPPNKFVRVHRSSIVNIDYIQRIELLEKQTQILHLYKGLQVKTSVSGYRLLKNKLNL